MRRNRTTTASIAGVALAAALLTGCGDMAGGGQSEDAGDAAWKPTGNTTMVVPFAPGGGSDLAGRAMAAGLEKSAKGLNVNVENRDGGSGAVGYSYFLSRKGNARYLLATETAMLALPLTQKVKFTYEDFTPIMKVGEDYTLMVAPKDSPMRTCADVVAKSKKERVVAGISGKTGLDNIVFTLTEQKNGAKFDRVPFESGSELTAALLGGQVDIASLNPGEVIGQLKSGDLKALCAYAPKRYTYDELKDIPTAKEQGIDVSFAQFRGVIATGDISDAQRDGWVTVAKKFAKSDDYQKYIDTNYLQPVTAYGDDFSTYLEENDAVLRKVLK